MRARFDDGQRFMVACVICGLLCGLTAVLFHLSIHRLFEWLWTTASSRERGGEFVLIMLGAPTVAGLVCGLIIRTTAPEAVGSGIPQTKEAYYNHGGRISLVTGFWRLVLGTVYVGFGNALGREGPTVHATSAIASRLGRWIFRDPERIRAMIPVGMAAGIGAAFNAPLSAITFVFEELLDNFSMKALGGIVVAVVIAAAVSRSILGEDPVLSIHLSLHYQTAVWMLVALPLGVLAGLLGHFFVSAVLGVRGTSLRQKAIPQWLAPAFGGLMCGGLGLAAWWLTGRNGAPEHGVFSIGYESLERAFENKLLVGALGVLLAFKLLAVVVNFGTGGSGGLFSPTLFLGGMLGGLVGNGLCVLNDHFALPGFPGNGQVVGGCVLLGMGAMFGSVIRAPFTSLIIIFEMTGNYSLILPLMGGNILAWGIAKKLRPIPIYDAILVQNGVSLKRLPAYRGSQDYRKLPISTIVTYDVTVLQSSDTADATLKRLKSQNTRYHAYPVVHPDGSLAGMVTHHELDSAEPTREIRSVIEGQDLLALPPDTSIRDAANRMIARNLQQVPVVSGKDKGKLLGILTLNDIARQQNAVEM